MIGEDRVLRQSSGSRSERRQCFEELSRAGGHAGPVVPRNSVPGQRRCGSVPPVEQFFSRTFLIAGGRPWITMSPKPEHRISVTVCRYIRR